MINSVNVLKRQSDDKYISVEVYFQPVFRSEKVFFELLRRFAVRPAFLVI